VDRSKLLIQERFRAFPPATGIPEFKGDKGPYKNAMSAVALLRNTLLKNMDQKVRDRLERIESLPESLKPTQAPGRPFMTTQIYDLILWHKLTLADVLCKDYTVRRGRMAALMPKLLMPQWEDMKGEGGTEEERRYDLTRIWTRTWKVLGWKHRPAKHHEAYWRLLHQRERHALGGDDHDDSTKAFRTGFCLNCGQKDTTEHAHARCPDIKQIWKEAGEVLISLIGAESVVEDMEINYSVSEIALCFPELRRRIPEIFRERVILWHSSVIFIITSDREWSLTHLTARDNRTNFRFANVLPRIRSEVRNIISNIFEKEKSLGKLDRFSIAWINSSRFVMRKGNNMLRFEE
jgi:hypothetical protein